MKLCIALKSGITAVLNPARAGMLLMLLMQDSVAALGESTGIRSLEQMRDKMLADCIGRKILRERPILNHIKETDPDTLGGATALFLFQNKIDIADRTEIKYIDDPELAYVMFRYR